MDKNEITFNINKYQNDIIKFNNKISVLIQKIEHLKLIDRKMINLQKSIEDSVNNRKNKLSSLANLQINPNLQRKYNDGMLEMLSGTEFVNLINGFSEHRSLISNRIMSTEDEVSNIRNNIVDLNNNIQDLRNKLRQIS